ncbi:MCAT [Symbiodinium sp. KB8]|nr:MCAT [Symbiodinium sp. KB8]
MRAVFSSCSRTLLSTVSKGSRSKEEQRGRSGTSSDVLLHKVAKALIVQSDYLSRLQSDHTVIFTFRNGDGPQLMVPLLHEVAANWRDQRSKGKVTKSLKQTLLQYVTAEIITRVTTFASDQSAQAKAQEMGWVTSDLEYNYLDWSAEEQRLVPRQEGTLTQDQVLADARRLKTLLKQQELIIKFSAARNAQPDSTSETATFVLELSLQIPAAAEAMAIFRKWFASSALLLLSLHFVSSRPADLFRVQLPLVGKNPIRLPCKAMQKVSCIWGPDPSPDIIELPGARRLREAARAVLDFDPLEGPGFQGFYELLRGPEGWLEHTQYCQPVMYITQLAAVEKLRDKRPAALERCKAVAGLSLGDFAALTFAGVWDFETGLRAVQLRGELMEAAMLESPQAALAVAGLSQETVEGLCVDCRKTGEVCEISQRLFADGFLCAGSDAAVERLLQRARSSRGCKQVQPVKLAGACHTSMMAEARMQMFDFLQSFAGNLQPPRIDVYLSCGTKVAAGSSPDWAALLADQLTQPANWIDSVVAMLKDGLGEFYECGPLNQLKGMMKRIDPMAYKATISLDVYSEEWQMRPAGSLPPRWAPWLHQELTGRSAPSRAFDGT